jgi:hypothetical protein
MYSRDRVAARSHLFAIHGAHRLFGVSRMPLQMHSAPSRFSDGHSDFSILYAALSFETCILDTLVGDRFPDGVKRELPPTEILAWGHARLATQYERESNLLDLRDTGCADIGAPADAVRSTHFSAGQALARAVHDEHPEVDGFIYASRLTGDDCIAVFNRAVEKFAVLDACELKNHPELSAVLERNKVVVSA